MKFKIGQVAFYVKDFDIIKRRLMVEIDIPLVGNHILTASVAIEENAVQPIFASLAVTRLPIDKLSQ